MDEKKKFIITEEQIKEIDYFLHNHSTMSIMPILRQLPLLEENKTEKEVK